MYWRIVLDFIPSLQVRPIRTIPCSLNEQINWELGPHWGALWARCPFKQLFSWCQICEPSVVMSQACWVYHNTSWPSDLQFQLHLFFGICVCKSVIIKVWYVDLDFLDVGIRKTDVTPMKGLLPTRGYRVRIIPGQGELGNNNNFRRCKNKTTVWNQDETNEANLKICKEDCKHAAENTTQQKTKDWLYISTNSNAKKPSPISK